VPKFIRELEEEQINMRKSIQKYKWQAPDDPDLMTQFLQHLYEKYDGSKDKVQAELNKMKKDGTLNQIMTAKKFDISQMMNDKL